MKNFEVEVVHCPDNEFPRGGRFKMADFWPSDTNVRTNTAQAGYWTPGMVIRKADGTLWRVVGEQFEPQRMVKVSDE